MMFTSRFSYLFILMLLPCMVGLCSCQHESSTGSSVPDLVEQYGVEYRKNLAEFRRKYPAALADFKQALISAYAALPETVVDDDDYMPNLEYRVWKKLRETPSFESLPPDIRNSEFGLLHGVYEALWEEIAAETDSSDSPENVKRCKAICNLYNYELEKSECCMPPKLEYYIYPHVEKVGIVRVPHLNPEWGLKGNTRYVRMETLSPKHQELVKWYIAASAHLFSQYSSQSGVLHEKLDSLLLDYYSRWNAIGK